ncbi:hypothetical protein ACR79T_12410 [Sphingobacterium spiritivorum]|uniref:hypothetical protein n=1 Tax=Sphingobacterium spiritivorum TaxID=258 RepID=UPI003DA6AC9C
MNKLIISFSDQSQSFTYGVEFGRLLERFQNGIDPITNNGFPVRMENKEVSIQTCRHHGYLPVFGVEKDGYIEFIAMKIVNQN